MLMEHCSAKTTTLQVHLIPSGSCVDKVQGMGHAVCCWWGETNPQTLTWVDCVSSLLGQHGSTIHFVNMFVTLSTWTPKCSYSRAKIWAIYSWSTQAHRIMLWGVVSLKIGYIKQLNTPQLWHVKLVDLQFSQDVHLLWWHALNRNTKCLEVSTETFS